MAFDPLDGSSIIAANFAVGSIFGVWPGALLGSSGRGQAAAAYAVYGPQTLLVWSRPRQGEALLTSRATGARACLEPSTVYLRTARVQALKHPCIVFAALGSPLVTEEYLLSPDGEQWHLRRSNISIPPTSNVFAPANLRAAAGNKVGMRRASSQILSRFYWTSANRR